MNWPDFVDRCIVFKGRSLDEVQDLMMEFCDDPETTVDDSDCMMKSLAVVKKRMTVKRKVV